MKGGESRLPHFYSPTEAYCRARSPVRLQPQFSGVFTLVIQCSAGQRLRFRKICPEPRKSGPSPEVPSDDTDMLEALVPEAGTRQDQEDYQRAKELLLGGDASGGSRVLGAIAKRTRNEPLRSQCLYNLGEVLAELGQLEQAYRTWYALGHKPPAERNRTDVMARATAMREFENHALRFEPPDFPPKVQLEITNRCNLRCIMCTRNQMSRPLGEMAFETLKRVADECCEQPGTVLSLYFLGEPLLNKELERMAAYLESVKDRPPLPMVFGLQTNGMLLTKERARSLLEAGLRNYAFSVDGLEGDLERIRPGASYPIVERNILDLIDLGRQMGIDNLIVTISKLCDDPEAEEVKRFQTRWEDKVHEIHLLGITRIAGNSFMAADGSVQGIAADGGPTQPVYCGQGQRLLVHWNGDFAFCCSDIDGQLELGNIHERSIHEAWHSPEIRRIRRKILAADYTGLTPCQSCPSSRCQT